MKRVVAVVTAGMLSLGGAALVGIGTASADSTTTTTVAPTTTTTAAPTTTTTLAPPIQGTAPLPIYMQVDTVTAGGGSGPLKPAYGCAQSNEFLVGQAVVFRMSAVNVAAGGTPLTAANTKSVVVNIPGTAPLPMDYGNHGTTAFWSAGWHTTSTTPLGVVHFTITLTTKAIPAVTKLHRVKVGNRYVMRRYIVKPGVPSKSWTYSQAGTPASSQLTLNAVPVA